MNHCKFFLLTASLSALIFSTNLFADTAHGLIRIKSPYSVNTTINNLEAVLNKKGMTVFKRVSHSEGASKVGLELRDTELLVFGNPKVGTPLMICQQTVALDLPQKALSYKDESGQVWLAYNDPAYLADRHKISGCAGTLNKISNALKKLTNAAIQ